MTRRRRESLTLAVVAVSMVWMALAPGRARAQFRQYTPPGTTAERPGDDRERLEDQMENALWEVGPLRLNPWVGITNAAFVTNAFTDSNDRGSTTSSNQEETDFTMTVGAGVLGIVPFGQKVFLTLEALPQYVLWLDQDDRNTFNEWYGARLHGFYNRLYLELGAARRDEVRVLSSEADQETNIRRDTADVLAEVRVGGAIHVFASAGVLEQTSLEEETDPRLAVFSSQDREETVFRGGLRYRPSEQVLLGVGVESSDTDFLEPDSDRSNSGEYPFVEISYDATKFFATGEIIFYDLEPEGELSRFVALDETAGSLQLTFNPGWRLEYSPYVTRRFNYALDQDYSHFEVNRFGLRVGAELSERWAASVFGETGTDDYVGLTPLSAPREDDVTAWGVDFTFEVSKRFDLTFGYNLTDFDSSLEGFDRDNGRVILNLGVSPLVLGRR